MGILLADRESAGISERAPPPFLAREGWEAESSWGILRCSGSSTFRILCRVLSSTRDVYDIMLAAIPLAIGAYEETAKRPFSRVLAQEVGRSFCLISLSLSLSLRISYRFLFNLYDIVVETTDVYEFVNIRCLTLHIARENAGDVYATRAIVTSRSIRNWRETQPVSPIKSHLVPLHAYPFTRTRAISIEGDGKC